jgi:hypothetical protein
MVMTVFEDDYKRNRCLEEIPDTPALAFFGRDAERGWAARAVAQGRPQLALLCGRRRTGAFGNSETFEESKRLLQSGYCRSVIEPAT